MTSALETRMKEQYENRTRYMLPRRTYTIIRCDGRAFHTYTRHMDRPMDLKLMDCMAGAAVALCEEAQGAQFGFTQSDEISVLLTDFAKPTTSAWFDGNIQKICSISAAVVTARFNKLAGYVNSEAQFDARVFTIPDPVEVENYFICRQKDAERNSVQMVAQHHYPHSSLVGVDRPGQLDKIYAAGDNWNNYPARFRRGTGITYGQCDADPRRFVDGWDYAAVPIFTADRNWLTSRVPRQWAEDQQ